MKWLAFCCCLLSADALAATLTTGAGGWHATAPIVNVAIAGRATRSSLLSPPALAKGHVLSSIRWRYQTEPLADVTAWFCHPQRCIRLPENHGYSTDVAGLEAGAAVWFEFQRNGVAVEVRNLQLYAQYR